MRIPWIVTLVIEVVNFLMAVILNLTGWSYYEVTLAGVIVLTLKNGFFTP